MLLLSRKSTSHSLLSVSPTLLPADRVGTGHVRKTFVSQFGFISPLC
jgi:hypothetical protein